MHTKCAESVLYTECVGCVHILRFGTSLHYRTWKVLSECAMHNTLCVQAGEHSMTHVHTVLHTYNLSVTYYHCSSPLRSNHCIYTCLCLLTTWQQSSHNIHPSAVPGLLINDKRNISTLHRLSSRVRPSTLRYHLAISAGGDGPSGLWQCWLTRD